MLLRRLLPVPLLLMVWLTTGYAAPGQDTPPTVSKSTTVVADLLQSPLEPVCYELPGAALATWRKHASAKPALVLFGSHPLLEPLHADRKEVLQLVREGSDADIVSRSRFADPAPLYLSPQAVSVAIAAQLISELVYVLPTKLPVDEMSLKDFRDRALKAGFITETEAKKLTLDDGVIKGEVRGIPLRAVHPERLPTIAGPVIVHIDLSYFMDRFVNNVTTPVYNTIYATAESLRDAGYQAAAVTLSFSNEEERISLDSRFVIRDLADIFRHPDYLKKSPAGWKMRAEALYLRSMFQESESRKLIAKAAELNPQDPAALYAWAMLQFQQGKSAAGFATLDRAVALDSGYGLAYIDLATRGEEIGQVDKAIELLRKATGIFPENPLIRIQLADDYLRENDWDNALELIDSLQSLPWAPPLHADIPPMLVKMQQVAKAGRSKAGSAAPTKAR